MPKTKLQEVVFTILMVFVMVYAMICYNIALNMGGMSNIVFLNAFHELVIMGPIAFILDFFLYGSLSKKLAFRIVTPGVDKPIMLILAISSITVCLMCPTMSFFATLLFKSAGKEFIAVWFQTTALNFPMAFFWQIFFAGPPSKYSASSFMTCGSFSLKIIPNIARTSGPAKKICANPINRQPRTVEKTTVSKCSFFYKENQNLPHITADRACEKEKNHK